MLKKFFLNFLSSFAGTWVALALFIVVCIFAVSGLLVKLAINSVDTVEVKKHSVLLVELSGTIEETEPDEFNPMAYIAPSMMEVAEVQSLRTIQQALEEAAYNKDIDMVYLHCDGVQASPATLHALRQSLIDFKELAPEKQLIAYGDSYTQGDYYLSTVADVIYLNPVGNVSLYGVGGQTPYFKGLFDKIGIQFQVAKVGEFKSAVEPFIMEEMSEPARAQLDTLYNQIWSIIKDGVAGTRGINSATVDSIVNKYIPMFTTAEFALEHKLVDKLAYENEVNKFIAEKTKKKKPADINFVDPATLVASADILKGNGTKNQVAVLYACGDIQEEAPEGINCHYLVPEINRLANDDNVKALVLRVNSGGGSAFGAEQIWYALENFKKSGKPFVVSMGDYAASGGYYISCGADKIYADSLTITGSIGIFGLFPNMSGLTEKIGVNMVTNGTNPNGMIQIPLKPLTEVQLQAAQKYVENGYDTFTGRVADGRKMSQEKVKHIGEGRVWDALKAKEIGLVDQLGSLDDAIEFAASKAGLSKDYNVAYYPEVSTNFWGLREAPGIQEMKLMQSREEWIANRLAGESSAKLVHKVHGILFRKPVQARMVDNTIYL